MDEHRAPWPMGESDGTAPTPLVFNPKGFLVLITQDDESAKGAEQVLLQAGFAQDELRTYTSQQILNDHEAYVAKQSAARRVVRNITTDPETPQLYFGYAREGRAAVWVRVAGQAAASRAVRAVAECKVLHVRHYGRDGSQEDMHFG